MTEREKRYRGMLISEWEMIELAEKYLKESDWPDGCEVLAVNYDFPRQGFILKVYHEDFGILTPGCMMPLGKMEKEND